MKKHKIKLDSRNYRKHDEANKRVINKSLKELGAGRSILLDSENEIIAGNATFEQAEKLGIPIKVIETDGTELIAVKRKDLKPSDQRRKELALIDNQSNDLSTFDYDLIGEDFGGIELTEWEFNEEDFKNVDFEPEDSGISHTEESDQSGNSFSPMDFEDGQEMDAQEEDGVGESKGHTGVHVMADSERDVNKNKNGSQKKSDEARSFPLAIVLQMQDYNRVMELKKLAKKRTDTDIFLYMLEKTEEWRMLNNESEGEED